MLYSKPPQRQSYKWGSLHYRLIDRLFKMGKKEGYFPIKEFCIINLPYRQRKDNHYWVSDLVWVKENKIEYVFEIETNGAGKKILGKFGSYPKDTKRYMIQPLSDKEIYVFYHSDKDSKMFFKKLRRRFKLKIRENKKKINYSKERELKLQRHLNKIKEIRYERFRNESRIQKYKKKIKDEI